MRRRFFNLLAALSLLAGIAVAALWARSYWVNELAAWQDEQISVGVLWGQGALCFEIYQGPVTVDGHLRLLKTNSPPRAMVYSLNGPPVLNQSWWSRRGLMWERRALPGTKISRLLVPCWLLQFLTLLLPVGWVLQRRRHGLCQCGYDLRATPNRCPECGTIAEAPATNPEPRTAHP